MRPFGVTHGERLIAKTNAQNRIHYPATRCIKLICCVLTGGPISLKVSKYKLLSVVGDFENQVI